MSLIPSRTITLVVPDAETESKFLLAVSQLAIRAYRQVHANPQLTPVPDDPPDRPPYKGHSVPSVA